MFLLKTIDKDEFLGDKQSLPFFISGLFEKRADVLKSAPSVSHSDAQAGLCLSCSQTPKTGFSTAHLRIALYSCAFLKQKGDIRVS